MKKSFVGLLIAALAITAAPVFAQGTSAAPQNAAPKADPDEKMLRGILAYGVGSYDIPSGKRSDLSRCNGTSAKAVVEAIGTCWPVLQTYQIFTALRGAIEKFDGLPPAQQRLATPEQSALLKAADDIVANAGARTYPAQDAPLMFAHLARATMASNLNDWEGFAAHLTAVRAIRASSRIDAAAFGPFTTEIIDQWLAEAKKRVAPSKK
jgi:hypothetical protein